MMSQFTLAASVMIGAPPVAAGLPAALPPDGFAVAAAGDCWAAGASEPPPPLPRTTMTAPMTSARTTGMAKGSARRAARLRARRRQADRGLLAINPPPRARHPP